MNDSMIMQVTMAAPPQAVFQALTDSAALTAWFAETADISLTEKRYDFWGRFTLETPDREQGRHPLLEVEPDRCLKFGWRLQGQDTTVEIRLIPQGQQTVVSVEQKNVTPSADGFWGYEDFWFLSLDNLRRYVDGKTDVVRCDYSAIKPGDVHQEIKINGSAEAVFAALINPEELNRWIASQARVEPKVGGQYELGWERSGSLKILELVSNEKLTILSPEDKETIVTWTLAESGGKTRLTLVHSGFAPDEQTDGLQTGWLNFMNRIKAMVEHGPAWQPPILKLRPGMESYYAASIVKAQASLL
ncbi:MAG TPA: SRPBCC domain-containing protein [Anaerolineae bacterium]|nr:SRPBCC domain-containing protein [Anaerolineae bacterium]